MKHTKLYAWLVGGAGVGLAASFWEMLDYIQLIKNPHAALSCNLNSAFSCTNVLSAWQSSVFGFPNALMCIILFSLMLGVGLAGLLGGTISRELRFIMHSFALFFLGFGLWFLWQSTYAIHALCILCIFCFAGLIAINGAWLRMNVGDLPWHRKLEPGIARGADIFAWIVLSLAVTFAMILQFA